MEQPMLFKIIRKANKNIPHSRDWCCVTYSAEFQEDLDKWLKDRLLAAKEYWPGYTFVLRTYTSIGKNVVYTDREV